MNRRIDTRHSQKAAPARSRQEKKNITLTSRELANLREAVLAKFIERTGIVIEHPERHFNTNLPNYTELYDSINEDHALESIGILSHKPLAVLFHYSRAQLHENTSFRKAFVSRLYMYAFGTSREEYLLHTKIPKSPLDAKQYQNIKGHWIAYLDKADSFSTTLRVKGKATLNRAVYYIYGDSMEDATFEMHQGKNVILGKVFAKGPNMILKSSGESDELYVAMNCGRNIEDFDDHIQKMIGCCNYIDEAGSPKAARCVMLPAQSLTQDEIKREFLQPYAFSIEEIHESIIVDSSVEQERELEDVKGYFYANAVNTLTANLSLFKEAAREGRHLILEREARV